MLPWAGGSCLLGPGLTQWKRPRGIRTAVALVAPGGCQATGLRAVPEARGWLWGPAPPAREELPGEDRGLGVELPQSRPQDPRSPKPPPPGRRARGPHPSRQWGCGWPLPRQCPGTCERGFLQGSEHSLGAQGLARETGGEKHLGFPQASGLGWTPAVQPPCGGQSGGLRGSLAPTAARSPTHSCLSRAPGTGGSGGSGRRVGGGASGGLCTGHCGRISTRFTAL